MIKVHIRKVDLRPYLISRNDCKDVKSFTESITIWYDPSIYTKYESEDNYGADKRFVIEVPQFISERTGVVKVHGKNAEDVIGKLYDEYRKYVESLVPKIKTKIILYKFNLHGDRHNDGGYGKSTFHFGGEQCSTEEVQRNLKINITWRIMWMVQQSDWIWLEEDDGKERTTLRGNGNRFNPNNPSYESWMNWTEEREAFFKKFSESMLDLMGMIYEFFGNVEDNHGAHDVAKKIDIGAFPMLESGESKDKNSKANE